MVTEWNRRAAEISGFPKQETMRQNLVQNFIEADNKKAVREVLQDAIAGRETAISSLS